VSARGVSRLAQRCWWRPSCAAALTLRVWLGVGLGLGLGLGVGSGVAHAATQPAGKDTVPNTFVVTDAPAWHTLTSPADKASVLMDIAEPELAVKLLKQWSPADDGEWVRMNRSIARVFAGLGQPAKAVVYLDEALALSQGQDPAVWRERLASQLGAAQWQAASQALADARFQGLIGQAERGVWHSVVSALQPPVQASAWQAVERDWQSLLGGGEAPVELVSVLIDAGQAALIQSGLQGQDTVASTPDLLAAGARAAVQQGDPVRAAAAYEQAALAYQRAGKPGRYLAHWARAQQLRGVTVSAHIETSVAVPVDAADAADVADIADDTPIQGPAALQQDALPSVARAQQAPAADEHASHAAQSADMRLTRRGAFLQGSDKAAPYFKPLSPKSFERFPFPTGTSVRGASGVVVGDGKRVLTNRHVVEGGKDFAIRTGLGEVSKARVVFMSDTDDLAILELDEPLPAQRALNVGDLRMAQPGSQVVAMGYPLWYLLGSQTPSLTNGVVAKAAGINEDPKMFQLTAKINRGNSGGPVFNMRGQLVGLTMGKLDSEALRLSEGIMPEDINFAIQADRIQEVLTGRYEGITQTASDNALKQPEQIYREMLGRVVIVAVAVD
jgi:serine protease Do